MYLVIDATILVSDKQFQQSLWKLLRARPDSWGLQVVVPWPAFQETVAHQVRFFDECLANARRLQSDTQRAGYQVPVDELVAFFGQAADHYPDELLARLQDARVDVFDRLDEIDHHEIVKRAVARRRPCDAKGDGYRDTLHWLLVLMLVRDEPNEQIIWATTDKDFRDRDGAMHNDLLEDLDKVDTDARMRVSLASDCQEILRTIVERHGKTDAELLPAATLERINELASQVLQDMEIDPIECGLPYSLRVNHGRIKVVTDTRPLEIPELDGEADVRPFMMQIEAECVIILSSRSDGSLEESDQTTLKSLVVRGSVELSDGAPLDVIIDDVEAAPGDPQVVHNRSFRDMVFALAKQSTGNDLQGLASAAAMMSQVNTAQLSSTVSEMLNKLQQPSVKDSLASATAAMMGSINKTAGLDAAANAAAFMQQANKSPGLGAATSAAAFIEQVNKIPGLPPVPGHGAFDAAANTAALIDQVNRSLVFDAGASAAALMNKAMKPLLADSLSFMERMHQQLYPVNVVPDLVRRMEGQLVPKSVLDKVLRESAELDADEREEDGVADYAVGDTENDPVGDEEE